MILLEASAVSAARLIAAVARHASADARPGQPDVVGLTWMWCSNAAGGALWETLVGEVGVRQYVQVGPAVCSWRPGSTTAWSCSCSMTTPDRRRRPDRTACAHNRTYARGAQVRLPRRVGGRHVSEPSEARAQDGSAETAAELDSRLEAAEHAAREADRLHGELAEAERAAAAEAQRRRVEAWQDFAATYGPGRVPASRRGRWGRAAPCTGRHRLRSCALGLPDRGPARGRAGPARA